MLETQQGETESRLVGKRVAADGDIIFVGGNKYQTKHRNIN